MRILPFGHKSAGGGSLNSEKLSNEELGVAKLVGFRSWLSIHPLMADSDAATMLDLNMSSCKMIVFAHHHRVLDGIQVSFCFFYILILVHVIQLV